MANIKISELPEATSFDTDDVSVIVQGNTTKKISSTAMLKQTNDNIDSKIVEVNEKITQTSDTITDTTNDIYKILGLDTDTYSTESTYVTNDRAKYNHHLYKANQDIETAEEWTPEHWTLIL